MAPTGKGPFGQSGINPSGTIGDHSPAPTPILDIVAILIVVAVLWWIFS